MAASQEMLHLQEENRRDEERHTKFSSPISPMILTGDVVRDDVHIELRTSPRDCNLFWKRRMAKIIASALMLQRAWRERAYGDRTDA